MKVTEAKYSKIKTAKGKIVDIASQYGVSPRTVSKIRGSLSYEAYKAKPGSPSFTNAMTSGKKKVGSSSTNSKPKPKTKTSTNSKPKPKPKTSTNSRPKPNPATPSTTQKSSCGVEEERIRPKEHDGPFTQEEIEYAYGLSVGTRELFDDLDARYRQLISDYVEKSERLDSMQRWLIGTLILSGVLVIVVAILLVLL